MSNSSLVNYTKLTKHMNAPRKDSIKKITIHHMAGNLSLETLGNMYQGTRESSCNYAIDSQGRVGMYVEESNRAWTSSSPSNDNQAITIEVANDQIGGNWHVNDTAYNKLIDLCVDICKRNGISKLNFTGDASGNLTMHCYFKNTACPGPYLKSKFPDIANKVNAQLSPSIPTPTPISSKPVLKSINVIAQEVLAGVWGNGSTRKAKLEASGYSYEAVQSEVNALVNGKSTSSTPAKKSIHTIAQEVIAGKWSNGATRKTRLTEAGYNYFEVQQEVNKLL